MRNLLPFIIENWELCSVLAALLIIYIGIEYRAQSAGANSLSPQLAALQMNRKNTVVLDIRKEPSYQAGHITGSLHCNMSQLKKLSQLEGLSPSLKKNLKSHTIIVVDDHGAQAAKAAKILKADAYTAVKTLRGGVSAWVQEKFPLTKAATATHIKHDDHKAKNDHTRSKKDKSSDTEE